MSVSHAICDAVWQRRKFSFLPHVSSAERYETFHIAYRLAELNSRRGRQSKAIARGMLRELTGGA
jgi:DNA polymerase IIIc chi subunit